MLICANKSFLHYARTHVARSTTLLTNTNVINLLNLMRGELSVLKKQKRESCHQGYYCTYAINLRVETIYHIHSPFNTIVYRY